MPQALVFRTLGTLDLRSGAGQELTATLAQPKRVALLAYLALAIPRGYHRRDTLLALFWPEFDQERARNALRQAAYHLRRSLGEGVLVNRGDEEMGLDEATFECDASAFERAVGERRYPEALALYQGDLLPGFFLADAPDFERWLEGERVRLRALAAKAAGFLAEGELAGNPAGAAVWASRALKFSPDDEKVLRLLITALDRSGDRASAVRAYEEFAQHLTREYQIQPSAESQGLIRTIRAREAPPQPPSAAVTPAVPDTTPPAPKATITGSATPVAVPPRGSRRIIAIVGVLVLAVSLGIGALRPPWRRVRPQPGETGDNLIVVVPFRVSGADRALGYLREGMLDLLGAKLTGAGGLRAADPRSVTTAWHQLGVPDSVDLPAEDALRLAQRLGGTRLLFGGIVGRPERLMITASMLEVTGGKALARASVEGSADSLPEMIDHLTALLLSQQAGESEQRLSALTSTSLPALRAYLEAQAAYRSGRYDAAVEGYEHAVGLDSNFALAAMGLAASGIWFPTAEPSRQRGFEIAWRWRDRLSPGDRAVLIALAGPRYPAISSWRERLDAWEAAVKAVPGRPDAWYEYGDILFHRGPMLGMSGSRDLAASAFGRSFGLDSAFAAPISHLMDVAAAEGDGKGVHTFAQLYLRVDSTSDLADYVRWREAVVEGDQAVLEQLRGRFDRMATGSLWRIVGSAQLDGVALDDAERAAVILRGRPATRLDQFEIFRYLMELALNRGRPGEAERMAEALSDVTDALSAPILNALYSDGDSAAAAATAHRLEAIVRLPMPSDPVGRAGRLWQLCDLEQWRVWRGDLEAAEQAVATLRAAQPPEVPNWAPANLGKCAAILDAAVGVARKDRDAPVRLARLDSLMLSVPEADPREAGNLALARLRERQGDLIGALAAVRRRQYHPRGGLPFLSTFLREEGRLSALTGDKEGAVRAYRHYLTLRSAPEPTRAAAAEAVRQELRRLEN